MEHIGDKLRIGDIIILEHARPNEGWLSAEGIIRADCKLEISDLVLEDCLWQICVQNQYSSSAEYDSMLENVGDTVVSDIDKRDVAHESENAKSSQLSSKASLEQKKSQLQRAALTERKLNKKLMTMKFGKTLHYGDVIQLLHIKSQSYLTVSSSNLARHERENLRVYLDSIGNSMSWLEFMPRYKYDREGQPIANDTELYIRLHDNSSEYIHAARKISKLSRNEAKEINCSLESSCWNINVYQKALDTKTPRTLLGTLVTFQEPESSTFLTSDISENGQASTESKVIMSNSLHLSFAASDCNVGTNLLWMIEGEEMFHGGAVTNHGSKVALRGLNSGLYMKMTADGVIAVKNREDCSFFEMSTSQPTELGAPISNDNLVQLSYQNRFITMKKGNEAKAQCMGSEDQSVALSMVVSSKLQHTLGVDLFACVDATKMLKRIIDILRAEDSNVPRSIAESNLRDNMSCFDFLDDFFFLEKVNRTSDEVHQKSGEIKKAQLDTASADVYVIRQTVMREQGALDVLLDLVELTSPAVIKAKKLSTAPLNMASPGKFILNPSLHQYHVELNEFSLRIIYLCIAKNHSNQVHISDRLPVLLELVKDSELAVSCVEEMIRDNLKILQTKIRAREIKIFLKMLVESEFNSTLLKLLRSTCSCQFGVDSTQRMVAEALFSANQSGSQQGAIGQKSITWSKESPMSGFSLIDRSYISITSSIPIVIAIIARYDNPRRMNWSNSKIYIPSNEYFADDVLGMDLMRKGVPQISISWQSEEYSVSSLFNGQQRDIPLEILSTSVESTPNIKESSKDSKIGMSKFSSSSIRKMKKKISSRAASSRLLKQVSQQTISEKKRIISEYFAAQLYLAADLCLDRNYVSIGLLEDCFPYTVLLSIMKRSAISTALKAPVCRLIRCLYVDREPQIKITYPGLVKVAAVVTGKKSDDCEVGIPGTEESSVTFGLLQMIISDFLHHDLNAASCDELSSEILETLLTLVQFGYYNSTEQLQDIITPLVQALDDHFLNRKKSSKGTKKKSSLLLLKGSRLSFGGKGDSEEDVEESSSSEKQSNRVNMNFKHTRKSLNDAMYKSLSNDASNDKGIAIDTSRRDVLASTSLEKKAFSEAEEVRIELRTLRALESIPSLIIILAIVIIGTIYATIQILNNRENSHHTFIFEMCLSCIFFFELTIRIYCYAVVYKELISFLSQPLNLLDVTLVLFDICLLSLDSTIVGGANGARSYAKSLKILRILRLVRVFRAARILKRIAERSSSASKWQEPLRYKQVTENEVRTISAILKVLSIIHLKIQDRKLSTALQAFSQWHASDKVEGSNGQKCDPLELYDRLMEDNNVLTDAFPRHFDSTLLDIVMYADDQLAQEGLNLLLLHKSQEELLFESMKKLQIVYTPRTESKFKHISETLKRMSRLAEAFEIWGKLQNPKELEVAEMALECITSVISIIKVDEHKTTIDLVSSLQVDSEVQLLLLNMNAIDIFMSLQFALLDASQEGSKHPTILDIVRACNDLIGLFVYRNISNQFQTFKHFDWFIRKVDDGVNSSKVIRAVLSGNRDLVKRCPRRHLSEFVQKIAVNGQRPEYLDLFVGLTDIEETGDSSISLLRHEISRYVTNAERSSYILLWCCSRGSKEYNARVEAMAPYLGLDNPPKDEDLSKDLQYHISLLQLLVGCKLGPKLQAIYPLDDVIVAILDPRTLFNVKRALGLLLLEMFEHHIYGLECSEYVWQFVEDCIDLFEETNEELSQQRHESSYMSTLRQRCEWMNISLTILTIFFKDFDFFVFNDEEIFADDSIMQLTERTEQDIRSTINSFFSQVNILRDRAGSLNKQSLQIIDETLACWENLTHEGAQDDYNFDDAPKLKKPTIAESGGKGLSKNDKCRRPSVVAELQQVFYRKQFIDFVNMIHEGKKVENVLSTDIVERLPSIYEPMNSDMRLEPFIRKIASHFRSQIYRSTTVRMLDKCFVDTCIWIIGTFQLLIEKTSGASCKNMFEMSVNHAEVEFTYYHLALNDYGVTYLCLDLIAVGIDSTLCVKAVEFLVVMLCKSAGRQQIQTIIHYYLSQTDSTLFFEKIKDLMEHLVLWCERNASTRLIPKQKQKADSESLPREVAVLLLISNMTADNFIPNKQIMHLQEGNSRFVNILDYLSHFLDVLSRLEGPICTQMSIRLAHTIQSLLQGPDKESQEHFVIRTEMLIALNRYMRSCKPTDLTAAWSEDLDKLKENLVDILRSSIEGQPSNSVVVERVQSTIEISILNVLILPIETDDYGNSLEVSNLSRLQAKYLVFLQALADEEVELPFNAKERACSDIGFVEVVWQGKLMRHYFHIPEIARDLPESSKRKITDSIAFSTHEKKLLDFLKKSRDLHREAEHQQVFKRFRILHLWSWQTYISKLLFLNCLVINALMTAYYTTDSDPSHHQGLNGPLFDFMQEETGRGIVRLLSESPNDISLPDRVFEAIHILNGFHIALSAVTYIVILAVQVPLLYKAHLDQGKWRVTSMIYALVDPTPLWYLVHTVIAMEAYSRSPLFLSLLLLQFIAVDSASNEVMLAVIYPFRQLITTLVIIVIFIHIFASTIFAFFRDEFLNLACNTMWQSFKLMISYGFRSEEGIGRYMEDTIGVRIIVDVAFYFVIVVILRNIFFGIIIDTFGELRGEKLDREIDANTRCFICGMDQSEFDKKSNGSHDFKQHREETHKLWNYLYFVMSIWHQPPSQDTSLEKYVRDCLSTKSVAWFPIGIVGVEEGDESSDDSDEDGLDHLVASSSAAPQPFPLPEKMKLRKSRDTDIDSQLQHIQDALGKLTSIQNNRSTMLPDGIAATGRPQSSSFNKMVELMVQKEIEPIAAALEAAVADIGNLQKRLQGMRDSQKKKKLLTLSSKSPS